MGNVIFLGESGHISSPVSRSSWDFQRHCVNRNDLRMGKDESFHFKMDENWSPYEL